VLSFFFYRGHPAVFINFKQIVIVPSNTTTFFLIQEGLHVSVSKDHHQANKGFFFSPTKSNSLPIRSTLPKRNLRGERNAISFTLTSSSKIYYQFRHTVCLPGHDTPLPSGQNVTFTRPPFQQFCNRTTTIVSTITVKYQSEFEIFLGFAASLCTVDVNQCQSCYLYTRSRVLFFYYITYSTKLREFF
jgi:hypothetical protein